MVWTPSLTIYSLFIGQILYNNKRNKSGAVLQLYYCVSMCSMVCQTCCIVRGWQLWWQCQWQCRGKPYYNSLSYILHTPIIHRKQFYKSHTTVYDIEYGNNIVLHIVHVVHHYTTQYTQRNLSNKIVLWSYARGVEFFHFHYNANVQNTNFKHC